MKKRRVIQMLEDKTKLDLMLVCLDLTDIDSHLIDYALFLAGKAGTSRIIFTHVIQAYDLTDLKPTELTELQEKVQSRLEARIDRLIKGPVHTRVLVEIEQEDASRRVIEISREQKADLVILGKKYGENRDLRYEKKITEEVESNLLFVPEDALLSTDHILCALDFSEDSKHAFTLALELKGGREAQLSCYYLYDTGSSYFPASTLRSSASFEQRLRKRVKAFLSEFDLKPEEVPCHIEIDDSQTRSHAQRLTDHAASLVIVGAKGDVSSATSVLGNTIKNLRHIDYRAPVLIIKGA
jgi:nucleotide-binding universal stress UspA family protein